MSLGLNWPIGLTYGQGQFVAVGGSTIATSRDGTDWVIQNRGVTNALRAVTYGNGRFVAVGGDYDLWDNPRNRIHIHGCHQLVR